MRHVSEVERFGRDSSDEAGVDRLAHCVQAALAVYLLPVLAVVLVIGIVALVLQGLIMALLWIRDVLHRQTREEELVAESSSRKVLLSLIPGQRFATQNGKRCGRYVPILGHLGEPSWSTSPTISLH